MKSKKKIGIREIPSYKIELVKELQTKMKQYRTILLASTKGLPSSQFHSIKKKFRGTAEINVAKKSLVIRALSGTEKGVLQLGNKINNGISKELEEIGLI